ncbi:MAG: hypothetical protein NTV94_05970, partial [Planctomycetota bacterium]|nr:hypothetical protein [Planctomycetota bacterium]
MASLTAAGYGQCGAAKLTSWEPQSFASFGTSVAVSGGVAIVGSPGDDAPGVTDCGAVYFFTQSGLVWQEGQKFQALDRAASDSFGNSVAIDGDWAAVGSPNDDYVGFNDLGSVYIYQRVNGVWVFEANVVAPVATRANFNRFSATLALSGNTLVVGAEHEGGNRGAAYVFVRSGTVWNLQQRLQPAVMPGTALYGCAVAIDGETLCVGAQGDDSVRGFATGAVYQYARTGVNWALLGKIVGSATTSSSQFGRSVAISGQTFAVTSPFEVAGGRTYMFSRSAGQLLLGQQLPHGTDVDLDG